MKTFFKVIFSRQIVSSTVRIALVVGTTLNLINQGEAIIAGAGISWRHVALNFLVPYAVASYSAAKHQLANGSTL